MASSDLVLNVRQIGGYPVSGDVGNGQSDLVLVQAGGLGGPYYSVSAANFVATACRNNSNFIVGGGILCNSISGGALGFSNGTFGALIAQSANFAAASVNGERVATFADIQNGVVQSWNGRVGVVSLYRQDIIEAGGAPIFEPRFLGEATAETPPPWSDSERLATTRFVNSQFNASIAHLLQTQPFVFTFNGRSGCVELTANDIVYAGGLANPNVNLTGIPTAPTAPPLTSTTQIATTQFVEQEINNAIMGTGNWAPINSPNFTGIPTGPTAAPGTSTSQLATTAFVMNAITNAIAGVVSFNGRTGIVTFQASDLTAVGGALLASPTFTGVPAGPTAAPGTNTTQLATTAFVHQAVAAAGGGVTSFNTRTGAVVFTAGDISGVGGALLASPAFSGNPTAPTAPPGTSNTTLATTAFVQAAISSAVAGVSSFNGRTGAVTFQANDISAVGGALLASPAFTGIPTAPTGAPGDASTQIATDAFVMAALAAQGGVTSFDGRTGAVTLQASDISSAGGALLASPTFTGTPAAPTAAPGTSTTQLATTAFVQAAIASGVGVTSFNGRTGAITLVAGDIAGAGGALLNSPGFTGTPTAPTATAGTSTTQIATTAFVTGAITTATGNFVKKTGDTMSGNLTISNSSAALILNGTGSGQQIIGQQSGTAYWNIKLGDSGGNFSINSSSAQIMAINRSNNYCTYYYNFAANGTLGAGGGEIDIWGTTNPKIMFNNAANTATMASIFSQSNAFVLQNNTIAGNPYIQIQADGTFAISAANAYKPGGGSWTAPSDQRIKTVKGNYTHGLSEVLRLNPVVFVYKGNDTLFPDVMTPYGRPHNDAEPTLPYLASPHYHPAIHKREFVGLVAQDAEKAMPSLVTKRRGFIDGREVDDFRDIDAGELTYALINSIKELARRIEKLEAGGLSSTNRKGK